MDMDISTEFALTLNGVEYDLVQDNVHPNKYYTTHDAFLYIERHNYAYGNVKGDANALPPNTSGEWWEVVTTDGTRYRLGWNNDSEQLALMYGYSCTTNGTSCLTPNGAYASLGYAGIAKDLVALRWRVDRVMDTHGNYMGYTYNEVQPSGSSTIAAFDRESYLNTISYTGFHNVAHPANDLPPAYKVHFVYGDRSTVGDVPTTFNIWDNLDTKLLDKIDVCYLNILTCRRAEREWHADVDQFEDHGWGIHRHPERTIRSRSGRAHDPIRISEYG